MMNAAELAISIGTGLGACGATFWATWAKLVKPLSQRVEDHAKATVAPEDFQTVRDDARSAAQALTTLQKDMTEVKDALKDLAESLRHCVTDDEFASYTGQTTGLINGLTEKVGRATGVLEAWANQPRR